VLGIRIHESLDAPYEVLTGSAARIPLRHADATLPAGIVDVERMIRRRDKAR
jgi:hypothetical protein